MAASIFLENFSDTFYFTRIVLMHYMLGSPILIFGCGQSSKSELETRQSIITIHYIKFQCSHFFLSPKYNANNKSSDERVKHFKQMFYYR